jgi:hypothetical protein
MSETTVSVRAFHRTTHEAGEAILHDGFEDGEGSYVADNTGRGVWVTLEQSSDEIIGGLAHDYGRPR